MSMVLKLLIGATCAVSTAQAVTITFSGVVTSSDPALALEYPLGATVELEYVFPEPVTASFSGPLGIGSKAYHGDISFSVSSGHGATSGGTHQFNVANDSIFVGDMIGGDSEFLLDSGFPMTAAGQSIDSYSLVLRDDDSVAFASDELVQSYDFSAFDFRELYVSYSGGGTASIATILIDDFQIVPEPSAAVLLGLSALVFFRRAR